MLYQFIDEMTQSKGSPTQSLSPRSIEGTQEVSVVENENNQDFSTKVLQVPLMIGSFITISTSWLNQCLERKKKRMIKQDAQNLDSWIQYIQVQNFKNQNRFRLVVNPILGNLFVEIAQLVIEKNTYEVDEDDFSITQVDVG